MASGIYQKMNNEKTTAPRCSCLLPLLQRGILDLEDERTHGYKEESIFLSQRWEVSAILVVELMFQIPEEPQMSDLPGKAGEESHRRQCGRDCYNHCLGPYPTWRHSLGLTDVIYYLDAQ